MIYADLIRFDPIESSVRLVEAGSLLAAEQLVDSYVVSDDVAGRLNAIIIPHLQIDQVCDNKGLLIIGGHGMGKSHLMSVVTGVAEYPELAGRIRQREVAEAAATLSARFKVMRLELPLNVPDLKQYVCLELQKALANWGLHYSFSARGLRPFSRTFAEVMRAFETAFPQHGLLLAIDELLDYFRGRGRLGLRQDLAFLRELGGACSQFRFRLLAGLQDRLSTRPDSLFPPALVRQVLDCFLQVPMPRNDLRFVVQQRLVTKSPEQQAKIREYLGPFMEFYGNMEDRLEEFVSMFPVHPDYLDVVGRVSCVDKTDVLRGLSESVNRLLDSPVPTEYPGLIAYDAFWPQVCASEQLSALPEIQAVVDGSERLETALNQSAIDPDRRLVARRVIHALSVHRLTTNVIYTADGPTPHEIRDQLCLPALPLQNPLAKAADNVLSQVVALFSDLHEAVDGKLLAVNPSNLQCYLRLNRFRRFVRDELILHWVNAVPFLLLMCTGAMMVTSRFLPVGRNFFQLAVTIHKCAAGFWLIFLPLTVLLHPRVHWSHLRHMLRWGRDDVIWVLQTLRSLHNKYAPMSPADRFNTGQKINACLVMTYFFGFGFTGLLMLLKGSVLLPWYVHTALFFLTLGSVSGHLFLSLVNPSTRIALAGIFHGWTPLEYVLHHHELSAPECLREHHASRAQSLFHELKAARRELALLAVALVLVGVDVMLYQHWRLERIKQVFARSFAEAVQPSALSTKHRLGKTAEACTKCHSYTGEIPNGKCEQCHQDIRDRRVARIGYHGNVQGDCRSCHKEHPASTNSVVPLNIAKFDHKLASFKLDGKHTRLACDECHKKKRPANSPGIYYIGVKHDSCQTCHADPHRAQFSATCETCHSTRGWTGGNLKFAHNKDSSFKLAGKHTSLDCTKCHQPRTSKAHLSTAVFKGLSQECAGCHKEPHQGQFASACTSCHSAAGWGGKHLVFEHNTQSQFQLIAKHSKAQCNKCHKPARAGEQLGFARFKGLKTDCADCHQEPHRGQFQSACTQCHPGPTSWTGKELRFTHNTDSQFILAGKHVSVACNKCHKTEKSGAPLGQARFKSLGQLCEDCHKVEHPPTYGPSCRSCHTVEGWPKKKPASDHILKQEIEGEPLGGKHLLVKCGDCHNLDRIGALQQVRRLKYQCKNCHQKDETHTDTPETDCAKCHGVGGWKKDDLRFDHDTVSTFVLNRDHRNVACFKCHENAKWKPVDPACESCHKNYKAKQL